MATYYVDDGGDGTTESSWATADTSINALDTEYTLASGDIVYFGHDMQCQATNAAALTITGPTSGAPCLFISATQGSSPPAYQASTTNQIDTSENASYHITFDGSFALFGMRIYSGGRVIPANDTDEFFSAHNCTFSFGNGGGIVVNAAGNFSRFYDCTFDYARDTGASAVGLYWLDTSQLSGYVLGCTFANASNRTGQAFTCGNNAANYKVSGCDFTSLTNVTPCELIDISSASWFEFNNCITAATWAPVTTNYPTAGGSATFVNVGPAYAPTYFYQRNIFGDIASSTSIYRTGGASIEGTACSWLITTRATYASEASPMKTPWIYGEISTTGSKTFDLFITNDSADFTDAEVWLEIEYLSTASEAVYGHSSDWRHRPDSSSYITTTAASQTDDTTSTWNGTGPSFTYKQKLSVTATVNQAGQYRARVVIGVASIASSRYFYIDPKVTVT